MRNIKLAIILHFTFCILHFVSAHGAETDTLDRLRAGLSGITSIRANYTQEKTLALFKQPLIIKGRMLLDEKGSLLWVTDEPVRSALTLRDGTLRQWDGETDRVTSMPVSQIPVLPALTTQIQNWLRGDFDALARDYEIAVESGSPPVLVCTPKQKEAAPFTRVRLAFNGEPLHLQQVTLEETGGNRSSFVFEEVKLNTPVRADDWKLPPQKEVKE